MSKAYPIIHRNYQDVNITKCDSLYTGYFSIQGYQLRFRRYDGQWTPTFERECFQRSNAAAVLLYDPLSDKVVLVEQLRVGAFADMTTNQSPWLIETVAGMLKEDETAEQVIVRETKEETGITIKDFIKITDYYSSPGGSSERVSLYCAKISADNAGGIHGLAEEMEDIQVLVFDVNEAFHAVDIGKIKNAATIIALQWLRINQKKLKKKWI